MAFDSFGFGNRGKTKEITLDSFNYDSCLSRHLQQNLKRYTNKKFNVHITRYYTPTIQSKLTYYPHFLQLKSSRPLPPSMHPSHSHSSLTRLCHGVESSIPNHTHVKPPRAHSICMVSHHGADLESHDRFESPKAGEVRVWREGVEKRCGGNSHEGVGCWGWGMGLGGSPRIWWR